VQPQQQQHTTYVGVGVLVCNPMLVVQGLNRAPSKQRAPLAFLSSFLASLPRLIWSLARFCVSVRTQVTPK
jgi:Tfp pilus assembly protein PilN